MLTDKQLAEIKARLDFPDFQGLYAQVWAEDYIRDVRALLAEVERLRAVIHAIADVEQSADGVFMAIDEVRHMSGPGS